MANALSMDLRTRFRKLMEDGLRAAAAGKLLMVSRATAARWGKRYGKVGLLNPCHRDRKEPLGRAAASWNPIFLSLQD